MALGISAAWLAAGSVRAQPQVRIPPTPRTLSQGNAIGGGLAPVAPNPTAPTVGAPTIGTPTFDPYATAPNAAASPPTLFGTPRPPTSQFGATPFPTAPAPYSSSVPTPGWPTAPAPSAAPYGSPFPNTGYPATYGQQPSVLFPNGAPLGPGWSPNIQWPQPQEGRYLRLFQDVRFRQTWLMGGDGPSEMGVDQSEIGTTINFPNFLWSQHPLQVSPVFAVDWWDGPEAALGTFPTDSASSFGAPPQVYSGSLGLGWRPHLTPQFWADIEAIVGVYSDFQGVTSDSVRFQGTGLGVLALTPTMTLKLGVTYLDRVDLKLLPAGGIVWTPNPQTRWDIYFPRPKLARYLTTIGSTDIWFYLNGEYGGGSWTIGDAAVDRRMDVNDIRVGGGLEWTHQVGIQGFAEAAYVFERELVFAADNSEVSLSDTLMVRGGIVY